MNYEPPEEGNKDYGHEAAGQEDSGSKDVSIDSLLENVISFVDEITYAYQQHDAAYQAKRRRRRGRNFF
jgi:hypothetical protein